jgi:glycine/D-amino acid oxidase-like deaminating enzyme
LVVVGAGIFGASLARQCARGGWDVVLVERIAPGHVRAGSGDESRLIRCCHGPDVWHTRSARRAWALWHEIDPSLVVDAGVAWLARRPDGWEAAGEAVLRAEGIPCSRVDARELFPSIAADDIAYTLLEPEAGILRAREAVKVLAAQAVAAGAELILAEARPADAAPSHGARRGQAAAVLLDDGRRLEADRIVWACGAWLPGLFPGLLDLRITHQDVFYFGATAAWRTPGVPGWVDYDGAAYGLGDLDGRGVKVSPDVEGPDIDPDAAERVALPDHEALARAYLAQRFPALAQAPLIGHRACQYELTSDTHFVIAPHPDHDARVWIMGGGSGHGFKHGPALAERMEAWLSGSEPAEPRFALGDRRTQIGLRTAGLQSQL